MKKDDEKGKADFIERKQIVGALEESEEKYRSLFQNVQDVFFETNLDGIILEISPSIKYFSDFDQEELLGTSIFDVYCNPEDSVVLLNTITLHGEIRDYELKLKTKNGQIKFVSVNARLIIGSDGQPDRIDGAVRDITERKLAEEALTESRQQLLDIIDFLPDATFVVDNEKKVIAWNKAIEEMTGVQKQNMIGRGDHAYAIPFYGREQNIFLDLIDDNVEELNARYSNIGRDGLSLHAEIFAPALYNGKGAYISVVGAPLFNGSGERIGSIESIRDVTNRKLAEEQLRLSNQRVALHIQHTPLAFIEFDLEGRVRGWNPAAVEIFGFSQEEAIGQYWTFIVPQEVWGSLDGVWDALVKQRGGSRSSNENITRNGREISCEWYNTPLIDPDGKTLGVASLVMDITDRKQAGEALVKLRKAIDNSGEAVFLTDREGIFTFVNPSFTSLYGFSPDEVVGKTTPRIIKSGVLDKSVYDFFWQTLLNGDEVKGELINKRKDGTLIDIDGSATPIIDEEKNIVGFLGIQRDITERKRAEERLRQQTDAMEAAIDGMALLNADGNYIYLNKSHARIYGYDDASELMGASWRILYNMDELQRFDQKIMPELNQNGHYQGRALGKKKNGSTFHQELSLTTLENGGLICTVRDITERKHEEQELIMAKEKAEESDMLKTAFLNNISHEIRTPFNGILGFLSIIQDFDLTGTERDEFISIVNKSAFRLINTINDIVEISQIQTGQLKPIASEVNIKRLTDDLFNKFKIDAECQGLEYTLNNDLPNDVEYISTDSTKLNTILSILIGNAIKFTKTGSIQIGIKLKAAGGYVEPTEKVSEPVELEFSVKDTGIGIPIDRQEAIFERFLQADFSNTRQFEGAGLGLSIAKAYVEMLGGRIWVESNPEDKSREKGATSYFTLPYNAESNEKPGIEKGVSSDSTVIPIDPEVSGLKILIVEDDEMSELFLRKTMKLFCNEILSVHTGPEAVKICRNNPDVDLIIMDIKMPDSNGYDATKQIRQFNEKVIIIAQTAFALSGDREKAIAAGCNDYIVKPIKKELLTELIQKYFQ